MLVEPYQKAKGYALRLFRFRPRTEAELRQKFAEKGVPGDISSRIIDEFKAAGVVDDTTFAVVWMQSRLKKYGLSRVIRELEGKGIPRDTIDSLAGRWHVDYDEGSVVRDIVRRRMKLYRNVEPKKRNRRLVDYLLRRGFSFDVINKVFKGENL